MKLSEQTSLYIAEYLKSALKHSRKYYNESQRKSESDVETVVDKDVKEERYSPIDEKSGKRPSTQSSIRSNGSFRKPVKCAEMTNGHEHPKSASLSRRKTISSDAVNVEDPDYKSSVLSRHHRSTKRMNDAVNYVSTYIYLFQTMQKSIGGNCKKELWEESRDKYVDFEFG